MALHNMKNPGGSKRRKRVGRGDSSGLGRTCGRGEKGQKSRSGSTIRPHFEGGQIPLFRRLPHIRGFKARNHKTYTIVNLTELSDEESVFTGKTVEAKGAFVIKVIHSIGAVAINRGWRHGVRHGAAFTVEEENRQLAQLTVIEVGRDISLAVVSDGRMKDVSQGASVKRKRNR